jgi:hypothetical protein
MLNVSRKDAEIFVIDRAFDASPHSSDFDPDNAGLMGCL